MAYIGTGGQFDPGLTNPSRQPGRLGITPGMANPGMKPLGTKPLPITPPITGGGGVPGQGPVALSAGSWPWPTTPQSPAQPATPKTPYDGSPTRTGAGKAAHFSWENDGIADYGAAPDMPTYTPGGVPIAGARAGAYQSYNPTAWNEPDIGIPEAGVNTRDIVASLKPRLEEEMAAGMGNAARRFGALGGLKGTGYATTLGASERKMFEDLNAMNYKYDYDAAQADANRMSTAREGTLGRAYGAWGQTENARANEANRRTGYNVGQQDRANETSRFNASRADSEAARKGGFDWQKYGAGLSEAQRKQMYDQMMLDYGG